MGVYLLKSSAILVIFWLLYVFFLEKENMHRFKRFYLVTSVLVAFIIPLLSITQYIYVESTDSFNFSNNLIPFAINEQQGVIETPFWTLESILWSVYILGVVLFSFRFIKNLFGIVKTIKTNEKQKQSSITFVLLKHLINPHTFLNFIFLNKFKFQKNEVPKEVLLHEEIHAKQRHSLDILFIELMQIVFWFQPFIWLFKCRIKLNHEFLADQAVIDAGYKPSTYQNTLLNYSSHQDYGLANAIDYSSIKKRFTVMKTQTSQQKKWTLRLLVLPLLGLLFYSFSNHEIVEVEKSANILVNGKPCDQCTLSVEAIKNLELNTNKNQEIVSFSAKISGKMTEFIKGNKLNETIKKYLSETSTPEFVQLLNIKVKGQKTPRNVLIQVKEGQQRIPSAKELAEYNSWAKKMKTKFEIMPESEKVNGYPHMINDEIFRYHKSIFKRMTKVQKDNSESLPEAVLVTEWPMPTAVIVNKTPNQQKPPTAKEIAEYNAWAKKMSGQISKAKSSKYSDYPIIKQKDIVRYKSIYNRMTEKQKATAEAFPNIPPPPPPVMDTIYTYKRLLNRVKSNPKNREANIIYLKKIYNEMNEKQKNQVENPSGIENLPPPPPPPPPTKVPQYKNGNRKTLKQIIEETPENVESGYEVLDNGESHYFIIYKSKKTYYNKDGFITDGKGNILPPPPPPPTPPAQKKANKSKGGPNADYIISDFQNCLQLPKSFITKNDEKLKIKCLENYTDNKLQIFNRWGNLVYSKENYNNNWDGTVEKSFAQDGSDKVIPGTYYYVFSSPKLEAQKAGYVLINSKNTDAVVIKKSK